VFAGAPCGPVGRQTHIDIDQKDERERKMVNKDVLEGNWKQTRGKVKEWWGKLTDDDLDKAAGKHDQIVGLIQEKYGYTHEKAMAEFDKRLKELKAK
jgi:uncharacterized protein YjbJ (UPF0337 family)